MLSRACFLRRAVPLAAVLSVAVAPWRAGSSEPGIPVLLISIDTLRADRLNCYGYKARRVSPNLDAFANDAILFEQHIASAPWTTPSHMSLLTSLCPTAHGVTHTYGEIFQGIRVRDRLPALPEDVGTLPEVLRQRGWTTAAFTGGITLDSRFGFGRGFQSYDTSMFKLHPQNVERLLRWFAENRDQPFLLFWHSFEVHTPYFSGDFLADVIPAERAGPLSRALARLGRDNVAPPKEDVVLQLLERRGAYTAPVSDALYDGGVLSVDRWIGRVFDHLRRLGLYDRTLIIVTSDHGEELGERKGKFYDSHGRTMFEEMIRVPLMLKLPHQAYGGTRVRLTTRAVDVMPTILDLASVSGANLKMQGASLRPLWEQPNRAQGRLALCESTVERNELKSLRSDSHKYVIEMSADHVKQFGRAVIPPVPASAQLFDLRGDPGEALNLLLPKGAPQSRASARRIAEVLDRDLRAQVAAQQRRARSVQSDGENIEGLRALGYVE
jgi:arylsulfatase A-like enzyme